MFHSSIFPSNKTNSLWTPKGLKRKYFFGLRKPILAFQELRMLLPPTNKGFGMYLAKL